MTQAFLPFSKPVIDEATIAAVGDVLRSGWITSGPQVQAFEARAVAPSAAGGRCAPSTPAPARMEIALRIAGIGPGDEVITTPLSWVATSQHDRRGRRRRRCSSTSTRSRATSTSTSVEAAITPRTQARSFPVYLSGLPVDMDRLYALARAARAARDRGRGAGARLALARQAHRRLRRLRLVQLPCRTRTSLRSKAAALVVNNEGEARLAREVPPAGHHAHAAPTACDVDVLGGKYNMTDVAARIGLGQLARTSSDSLRAAGSWRALFRELRGAARRDSWRPAAGRGHCRHQLAHVPDRAAARELIDRRAGFHGTRLQARGIGTACHYAAIHLFSLYRARGFKEGMFPEAEQVGAAERLPAAVHAA